MTSVVILASGRGSNFDAIQRSIEDHELQAEVCAVISDQSDALVLSKAKYKKIPTLCIPFPEARNASGKPLALEERRKAHDERLLMQLQKWNPRFLVLAGYRRIISPWLIETFRSERGYSRIVNIHPSLLPAFPGLGSYAQAYAYGVKLTGATVHLVEDQVDSGPICAQEAFSIGDCKSEFEVEEKGLAVEHRLFPRTLSWVLPEKFKVELRPSLKKSDERRFCVCPD